MNQLIIFSKQYVLFDQVLFPNPQISRYRIYDLATTDFMVNFNESVNSTAKFFDHMKLFFFNETCEKNSRGLNILEQTHNLKLLFWGGNEQKNLNHFFVVKVPNLWIKVGKPMIRGLGSSFFLVTQHLWIKKFKLFNLIFHNHSFCAIRKSCGISEKLKKMHLE